MEVSSKNPSQMIFKQPISSQIVLKDQPILKKKSEYLEKLHFQNILTLEDGFSDLKPFRTVLNLFPKNWYFKPWDLHKPQSFYQSILETTGSAKFKHFKKDETQLHPSYSTCTIQRIIHPSEWGPELHKGKPFPADLYTRNIHCGLFNYWDYQQAWYNAFFIQNESQTHSWLFFFDREFQTTKLPF